MPQKNEQNLNILADIAKVFAESLNLETTLQSILKSLDTHLKFKWGVINLFNPETERINVEVAYGLSDEDMKKGSYKMGEGITGSVVETGKPVVVPDVHEDSRFLGKMVDLYSEEGKNLSMYCIPVKLKNRTVGALSVFKTAAKKDDYSEIIHLLNVIATMIAQAVKLHILVESERAGLQNENKVLRQELKTHFDVHNMIGTGNAMKGVYRLIEQVADSNATVMVRGESGTGKDLVAHAVHYNSLRSDKPFIKINCTALPDTLLESELFGHEKGAFTGAVERKIGRFERADGGTIFLDEIGDFSMSLQVKLLRVIQFKEFERVGGTQTIKTNVRIVVATNKDLEHEISEGLFREDLYYRINVFPIFLPPLRERKDDIMLLADFFLEKYAQGNSRRINRISSPAIDILTAYHWPGNIRELENCMERAVLVCDEEVIRSSHLPPSLQMAHGVDATESRKKRSLPEMVENLEREQITDALKRSGGHQRQASKELGITERILGYKIQKFGIIPKILN